MPKIAVIPDCQIKPGDSYVYLGFAGTYIAEKKPEYIVCLGDFADMPSLSSYDVGKKSFEGRKYSDDILSAREAMQWFLRPIRSEQERLRRNKDKGWNPKLIFTLGNHEDRINRAIENDRKLEGLISTKDLGYEEFGWTVVPYLEPISIEGVSFCHYFVSGVLGRPVTSARMLLTKKHMSCVAGHQQGRDIAYSQRADGKHLTAIITGSFYEHDEQYLNAQSNNHWRGMWFLNEVRDGQFDELPISIEYLKSRYSQSKFASGISRHYEQRQNAQST